MYKKANEVINQVNKAEFDKVSFDIAEIYGEIKSMQRDLSTANNCSEIVKLKRPSVRVATESCEQRQANEENK